MENILSRQTVNSVLRSMLYFLGWAIVVHTIFVLALWIFGKQPIKYIFAHPLFDPRRGIALWLLAGIIHGYLRRSRIPLSLLTWGRYALYMSLFSIFISSLQIYYVHRKNTGWYDMAKNERCYNKYHSFWLIHDKQYFNGIDNCLKNKITSGNDAFGRPNTVTEIRTSGNISMDKTRFIDYDIVTPRILWILVAFIILSLIEMIRRYGLIGFFHRSGNWRRAWDAGLKGINNEKWKLIFGGMVITLGLMAFLPKIMGYPSGSIPIILLFAAFIFSLKNAICSSQAKLRSDGLPALQFMTLGAIIASLVLVIVSIKGIYFLLVISAVVFILLLRKTSMPAPAVLKIGLIIFFAMEHELLWADDGTWSTGGLDALINDSAGSGAIHNIEDLSDTVSVSIPLTLPEPEPAPDEESVNPDDILGTGPQPTTDHPAPVTTGTTDTTGTPKPPPIVNEPLGMDPPVDNP